MGEGEEGFDDGERLGRWGRGGGEEEGAGRGAGRWLFE